MPDLLCPSVSGADKKGSAFKILTTEGIGSIDATAVFKTPAPQCRDFVCAMGRQRRGSKGLRRGQGAGTPKLSPIDPIKPEKLYPLGVDDIKEYPKYEKIWKEIFKIR